MYGNRLNQTQSHDITCFSPRLHRSTYYHKQLDSARSRNESQLDMIHCEAPSTGYSHLNLYDDASRDGIVQSLITTSEACVTNDHHSVNYTCIQVILYINLTYYDQHNGSTIPVCAFRNSDHNLECFCIHYLTLGKSNQCAI